MAQKVRMDKQISKTLDEFFRKFTVLKYRKGEILVRSDDSPSALQYKNVR